MEQQIRFCTTADGVRIAYATVGEGPPLVYVNGWPEHLEVEWEKPFVRSFLQALAHGSTLIRYDMRGSGLSDRHVSDFSIDALTKDLEAVVGHLALDRFALLSLGLLGGPIAITYAASHPQRLTHLIMYSAYLRGGEIAPPERQKAIIEYVSAFGVPHFEWIDRPGVDVQQMRDVREIQKAGAPPAVQAALLRTMYSADVSGLVERLTVPLLIMHGRGDPLMPFEVGREVAARLPHARFVPFQGASPAVWAVSDIIVPEIHRFLGVESEPPEAQAPAAPSGLMTILFTDMEGSTTLTQRLGDAGAQELVRTHNAIVREALKACGGAEIKHTGDGIMASFPSASRALECAIAIQRAFDERNASLPAHPELVEAAHPEPVEGAEPQPSAHPSRASGRADGDVRTTPGGEPIRVRVSLNAGEPVAEEADLFGAAVQLARRICDHAQPGQIMASNVVRELAMGKGFLFADSGDVVLKGFEDPVRLYEVRWREG